MADNRDPKQVERERIAAKLRAIPAQVPYRSPSYRGGVHLSEQEYNLILDERLSDLGIMLDRIRDTIDQDARANKWIELKHAIASAAAMSDPYKKIDVVKQLEQTVRNFAG